MKDETRYCVVDRPGYFGYNRANVYSSHRSLDAAIRTMKKSGYFDERGQKRFPCCVVKTSKRKGDVLWGDMFPEVIA